MSEEYISLPSALSESSASVLAASGCDGSSSCESGVFQSCDGSCEGCQVAAQCGSNCQTTCEISCQSACQSSSQCGACESTTQCSTGCQVVFQCVTGCQVSCQEGCEVSSQCSCMGASCEACQSCQTTCQNTCQGCQGSSCQTCQSTCQSACQDTCELSCQNCEGVACQTCQTACEAAYQATDYFAWQFQSVTAGTNSDDTVVRGLWSGFVGGREVICAACNGYLWELELQDGTWSKTSCGEVNTENDVTMFGFSEKLYLLNGTEYKVWDGEVLTDVVGYVPLIAVAAVPSGGGTTLEQVNKLSPKRRMRFSPDGEATVFVLPEKNLVSVDSVTDLSGGTLPEYSTDLAAGTVTFTSAPATGIDSLEIAWTVDADDSALVRGMRYMELYNGAQDSRVFLYGDGTNQCIYSGLDENGQARADYFPDLNVARVGDANTPITGMIRHYNKLMAFKLDSAWVISYDTMTLDGGSVTASFYIAPVNRSVGNCAPGQVLLVENQPRTLDGRSIVEWKSSSAGSITGDQRNAQRVSQRVDSTIRSFNLETAKTYYDKYAHEYYVIGADGTALVNNVDADAWYIYTDFAAVCLINYKDELYFGTADGYLRHCSNAYFSDNGNAIDAYWESGSMPFDRDFMRKYSAMIWIGIKPEENGYLVVSAETDRKSDFAEYSFSTDDAGAVPTMHRLKLKAKKFTYYKLILSNNTADTTATVVSADIRIRATGYVR